MATTAYQDPLTCWGGSSNPICSRDGIYTTSRTPHHLPWNTYNYCNAPHVNAEHYSVPGNATDVELVYLNVVMRHHKRTPDNLFPSENALNPSSGWDCSDLTQHIYPAGGAKVFKETSIPSWHPYARLIWNGSCDAGQLTREGFDDSVRHGKDFWGVYHEKLGFLDTVNEEDILVRTSNEVRTQHVASGFLYGMDPSIAHRSFPVYAQPSSIDSLVPNYACPKANSIREAYQSVPAWTNHLDENRGLKARLDDTLGTAGLGSWASWYDHYFDAFASRTCHGHPLPCNSTGGCVEVEDAKKVFELGDFEYDYIWNAAENAREYVRLTFGIFFSELLQNFKAVQAGTMTHKLAMYVGHDGSMIRLVSGLGMGGNGALRWPALGSEVVMEVWRWRGREFVRVMHEGRAVAGMEWVRMEAFVAVLAGLVRGDVWGECMSSS